MLLATGSLVTKIKTRIGLMASLQGRQNQNTNEWLSDPWIYLSCQSSFVIIYVQPLKELHAADQRYSEFSVPSPTQRGYAWLPHSEASVIFLCYASAASSVMTNYKTTYYPNPRTMCFVISLALLAALDSVAGKMLYKLQYSKQLRLCCLLFHFMKMSHSFEIFSARYTRIITSCSYSQSS